MTTPFERPTADEPLRATWHDLTANVPAPGAHLTEDDWVELAAGELDDATRERFADHIEACAACADVFRAVGHVRAGAGAIDPEAPPLPPSAEPALDVPAAAARASLGRTPGAPSTSRGWWYGVAAAAVIALAVSAALWRGSPGAEPATQVSQSAAMAPPARAGAATAAPPPTVTPAIAPPRAWAALATAPAVTLPASFTIVMRGEANPARDAFLQAFGPAIAPYRDGRYADAAEALQALTSRFPAVDEAWFYLGVSRLHAGRPADAVEPLRRARQSEVVAEQAMWLEAVALEQSGRTAEATAALRAACDVDRQAHAEACASLPAPPR